MRCDGEPVRLGMRTTRRMSRASQPDKQNGTLSVHTIRASGHGNRTNRPNTRLHPTTTPKHQINPCNAGAIHTGHSSPVSPMAASDRWRSGRTQNKARQSLKNGDSWFSRRVLLSSAPNSSTYRLGLPTQRYRSRLVHVQFVAS